MTTAFGFPLWGHRTTARDRYRRKVVQLGTGLEQLLDRLEFGPVKRKEGLVSKLLR